MRLQNAIYTVLDNIYERDPNLIPVIESLNIVTCEGTPIEIDEDIHVSEVHHREASAHADPIWGMKSYVAWTRQR